MSATLLKSVVMLPPGTIDVVLADVDGDNKLDVVAAAKDSLTAIPAPISLFVYQQDGSEWRKTKQVSLGQEALFWQAQQGLWAVDEKGVRDLWQGTRAVHQDTWLVGLGHTSPKRADVVCDLESDGVPEFVLYGAKGLMLAKTDGSIQSHTQQLNGSIRQYTKTGGVQFEVARRTRPVLFRDWNGDGVADVWWLDGAQAIVSLNGETVTVDLPINVEPQYSSRPKKELSWLEFSDINGDGLTDLTWQYWVRGESWFGSTSEIGYSLSDGVSFTPAVTLSVKKAVLDVALQDWDGDGDLDLWLLSTDLGIGSLSKALLTQEGTASLAVLPYDEQGFNQSKSIALTIDIPIGQDDAFDVTVLSDMNGDSMADIVLMIEEEAQLFQSTQKGWIQVGGLNLQHRGNWVEPSELKNQNTRLLWTAGQPTAVVLSVQ